MQNMEIYIDNIRTDTEIPEIKEKFNFALVLIIVIK